jgi:Predicted ATPase
VTFADPSSAILGAIDGQVALANATWPADSHVRVRMGIHVGEVTIDEDDDYVGLAVHQAARISAAAHGGQVLTSKAIQAQAEQRVPPGRVTEADRTLPAQGLPRAPRPVPVASPRPSGRLPRSAHRSRRTTQPAEGHLEFHRPGPRRGGARRALGNRPARHVDRSGRLREDAPCYRSSFRVPSRRPDGIWFVDLAPVSDRELVSRLRRTRWGFKRAGPLSRLRLDRSPVAGRPLVILDNCEHLIPTCAS